jgi:fructose-1,6-bisphosphatase/inositol monophosphatase family enzyme
VTAPAHSARTLEKARRLLCSLEDFIRDSLTKARERGAGDFARISAVTAADTIYRIDRVSEAAILDWFGRRWPADWPVELVAEGLGEDAPVTFPKGVPVERTAWKCILDPIDGTRSLMYDKRAAWILAGLAPQRGARNHLGDIVVAAMTELPTSKQWRSDQISAIRGRGPRGIVAEAVDCRSFHRTRRRLVLRPSSARDCRHGFASLVRFFPEGKALTAEIEESLWRTLYGSAASGSPVVFDDQYLATGGQIYELLSGHDRMLGDIRPLVFAKLGLKTALVCHPYDICTSLILEEIGGVVETPFGGPVRAPLDTTSPVAWVGYANPALARAIRPALRRVLKRHLRVS